MTSELVIVEQPQYTEVVISQQMLVEIIVPDPILVYVSDSLQTSLAQNDTVLVEVETAPVVQCLATEVVEVSMGVPGPRGPVGPQGPAGFEWITTQW